MAYSQKSRVLNLIFNIIYYLSNWQNGIEYYVDIKVDNILRCLKQKQFNWFTSSVALKAYQWNDEGNLRFAGLLLGDRSAPGPEHEMVYSEVVGWTKLKQRLLFLLQWWRDKGTLTSSCLLSVIDLLVESCSFQFLFLIVTFLMISVFYAFEFSFFIVCCCLFWIYSRLSE